MLSLIAILLVPVHFGLQAENQPELDMKAKLTWAGGLFEFTILYNGGVITRRLRIFGLKRDLKPGEDRVKTSKPGRRQRKRPLTDYLNRLIMIALTRLLRKLFRAMRLEINLSGSYGLEEPDLTAIIAVVIMLLGSNSINLSPDYSQAVLNVRGHIRGRVIPAQILGIGIQFLFSQPVRAIWWPKIQIKRKRKEIIQYV